MTVVLNGTALTVVDYGTSCVSFGTWVNFGGMQWHIIAHNWVPVERGLVISTKRPPPFWAQQGRYKKGRRGEHG